MLNEKQIATLIRNGFKRWTKGSMDRLYIDALTVANEDSGLAAQISRSGSFEVQVSATKMYIDIKTGERVINYVTKDYSDRKDLKKAFDDVIDNILA